MKHYYLLGALLALVFAGCHRATSWEVTTYDAEGRETAFYYFTGDSVLANDSIRGYARRETTYDANGNKISCLCYDADDNLANSKRDGWAREEWTYDANGNCTKRACYDLDGAEKYREEWKYNSNDDTTFYASYKDGAETWREEWKYNSKGNRISFVSYNDAGNLVWRDTYDGKGHRTSHALFDDGAETWREEWTYDANGNCTSFANYEDGHLSEMSVGDEWNTSLEYYARWEKTYDSAGNCTSYARYGEDGGPISDQWAREEWTYDANSNCTSSTSFDEDGIVGRREEWTYDANSNCTGYKSFDADGNCIANVDYDVEDRPNKPEKEAIQEKAEPSAPQYAKKVEKSIAPWLKNTKSTTRNLVRAIIGQTTSTTCYYDADGHLVCGERGWARREWCYELYHKDYDADGRKIASTRSDYFLDILLVAFIYLFIFILACIPFLLIAAVVWLLRKLIKKRRSDGKS